MALAILQQLSIITVLMSFNMRRGQERLDLPSDFPAQLLAAEFALEQEGSAEHVNALVSLYQAAIEHYEHKGDSKFLDYQARMHRLFTRPDILESLHHLVQPFPRLHHSASAHLPSLSDSSSVELSAVSPIKQGRKTDSLLEVQIKSTTIACSNVKKDVAHQNSTLRSRLARRKEGRRSMDLDRIPTASLQTGGDSLTVSKGRPSLVRAPSLQLYTGSDKSGGLPKVKPQMDELARRLEETMEQIYAERATSETTIRLNYEKQIAEMEKDMDCSSRIVQQVISSMRQSMERDLSQLRKDMEERCKVETVRITAECSN